MKNSYSPDFYTRREARVARSADALVPEVVKLLRPRSVVDIGCANGLWLRSFAENGVELTRGVDGPWVPRNKLRIAQESFAEYDLGKASLPYAPPLPETRYDLLISFELLEHLPGDRADALVDLMCSLSDTLLVSAAVPHQGGTGHVNEQWPDYWGARFSERGFVACDFLRPAVWNDERVAPWYRQNVIGYFRGGVPAHVREFARSHVDRLIDEPLPLCHPGVFSYKLGKMHSWLANPARMALREWKRRRQA
jgi:hypothetical protein